jgi:hypothetical protein
MLMWLHLAGCLPERDAGEDSLLLAVLPYTGSFDDKGELHENAIRMALEDLIGAGIQSALGRELKVLTVSSGDGEEVVEDSVRDILEGPDGDSVLGILTSTAAAHEGAARVSVELGVPHFEVSSGSSDEEFLDPAQWLPEQLAYLLSARPLCDYEAEYTARYILQAHPTARVALVRGDDMHDMMHTSMIRSTLLESGFAGTVLESGEGGMSMGPEPDAGQDFVVSYDALAAGGIEPELAAIVQEHAPDVIFFHVRGDSGNLRFLQDTQRSGFQGSVVSCGMARTPALVDPNENGLLSDYLVGHDTEADQDRLLFAMRGPLPSARLDAFKAEYEARFDKSADTFTPAAYDATMLWALGVLAARSADRASVLAAILDTSRTGALSSREDLGALVEGVSSGQDVDYDGVSGPMDMREDRTVPGYYYMERVIPAGEAYSYEKLSSPPPETF